MEKKYITTLHYIAYSIIIKNYGNIPSFIECYYSPSIIELIPNDATRIIYSRYLVCNNKIDDYILNIILTYFYFYDIINLSDREYDHYRYNLRLCKISERTYTNIIKRINEQPENKDASSILNLMKIRFLLLQKNDIDINYLMSLDKKYTQPSTMGIYLMDAIVSHNFKLADNIIKLLYPEDDDSFYIRWINDHGERNLIIKKYDDTSKLYNVARLRENEIYTIIYLTSLIIHDDVEIFKYIFEKISNKRRFNKDIIDQIIKYDTIEIFKYYINTYYAEKAFYIPKVFEYKSIKIYRYLKESHNFRYEIECEKVGIDEKLIYIVIDQDSHEMTAFEPHAFGDRKYLVNIPIIDDVFDTSSIIKLYEFEEIIIKIINYSVKNNKLEIMFDYFKFVNLFEMRKYYIIKFLVERIYSEFLSSNRNSLYYYCDNIYEESIKKRYADDIYYHAILELFDNNGMYYFIYDRDHKKIPMLLDKAKQNGIQLNNMRLYYGLNSEKANK